MHLRSNFKVNMIRACSKIDSKRHACTREWIKKSAVNIGAWEGKPDSSTANWCTSQYSTNATHIGLTNELKIIFPFPELNRCCFFHWKKAICIRKIRDFLVDPIFFCLVLRTVPYRYSQVRFGTVPYSTFSNIEWSDSLHSVAKQPRTVRYGTIVTRTLKKFFTEKFKFS